LLVQTRTRQVVCFLTPDFELAELAPVLSVLSQVGRQWNWRAFRVQLVSASEGTLRSNCQVEVGPVSKLSAENQADVLVLPGGYNCLDAIADDSLRKELLRVAQSATVVLSCSRGSLLFAALGLAGNARVACTPEMAAELNRLEPSVSVSSIPVESHARWISCASAVNAAEAALRLVGKLLGSKIAQQTAAALGLPEPLLVLDSTRLDPLA
jgi:transcriptional regulator GlxA family with amidase domain